MWPTSLSFDRRDFQQVLTEIQTHGWPDRLELAGPGHGKAPAVQFPQDICVDARISILLAGRRRFAVTRQKSRREIVLQPGEGLYWPPHAWNEFSWEEPFLAFGIVFRAAFTRYLVTECRGGPASLIPRIWHTARPLDGAGVHLIRALNAVTKDPKPDRDFARRLSADLLLLAARHLAADEENPKKTGARHSWELALEYVHQHFQDPGLSRESVAEALGMHPNYLSALARQEGGGFHRTLEDIRMSRVKHLLEETPLTLAEIAAQCGYAGSHSLLRAYKRVTGRTPKAGRQRGRS